MLRTRHTADVPDLLAQGTFVLRRGLARLTRRPSPRVEPPAALHVRSDGTPQASSSATAVQPSAGSPSR